jgi:hypothetical protein
MKILFTLFFYLISSVCLATDWTVDKCWVTNDIGIATNPNASYLYAHIINFPNFEKDYDKICLIDNTTGKEVGDFWGKKDKTDTIIYEIDKNKKIDLSNLQLKFAENKVKIEVEGYRPVYTRPVSVIREVTQGVAITQETQDPIARTVGINPDDPTVGINPDKGKVEKNGEKCDDDITIDDPGEAIARTVGINPGKGNGEGEGKGEGCGEGPGSGGGCPCDDSGNPYGDYTPYPKETLKIPLPKIKNPLTTGFILYLTTGDDTSEGIIYQVDDKGLVMGKVKIPNTAMGISMHRDNALMLSVPRDGGKILRINDTGKVEMPILEKNKLLPCPTKIYLPKNSDNAVIYDDITKGLSEINSNGRSPEKFDGENPFTSIMDSNTGNVAIAKGLNKIDIKSGDTVIKTLTLPSDKTFYKDGLMSWSGVGTLCVTCNGEDGIPWLIMYDIDNNKVQTLFPWKPDLQGVSIGPRMRWDYNAKSDYKSTF